MKNVMVRIQEYLPHSSATEYAILKFLQQHPRDVGQCTTKILAKKTFSSPPTIIRLCHKLGFNGYTELRNSIIYESALSQTDSARFTDEIQSGDSFETIIAKTTATNIQAVETTSKLLEPQKLRQCVKLLDDARMLSLFGIGSSLLVANDAYLKFLRVDKLCQLSMDWHAQLLQAKNITKHDVAIIVSYSGMTEEMLKCGEAIKAQGAPIILISRFLESPLSKLADYVLAVSTPEQIYRVGAMSSRIAQLSIVDILYTAYIHDHPDLAEQFRRTFILKENDERGDGDGRIR